MSKQFVTGYPQPPTNVQLSRKEVEQWTSTAVLAGLRTLAESRVQDFQALEHAMNRLPEILHPRWTKTIGEMKATAASMLAPLSGEPASPQRVFVRLLRILNDRWFMDMKLFLARHPDCKKGGAEEPSLWDQATVQYYRIAQLRTFHCSDGEIPVCFLETPPNRVSQRFAGLYDGVQAATLVSLSAIRWEAAQIRRVCGMTLAPWEVELTGPSRPVRETFAKYARTAIALFPEPQRLFEAVILRTLVEEIRHAIDGGRVLIDGQGRLHASPEVYYRALVEQLLSPNSVARQFWTNNHPNRDLAWLGKVTSELSANLTALAVGPDPRLVLAEWMMQIVEGSDEWESLGCLPPHAEANVIGACLLGEGLGLLVDTNQDSLSLVLDLLERIAISQPEQIRLVSASIYAREFLKGKIDEAPFQQIGADGTLVGPQVLITAKRADGG